MCVESLSGLFFVYIFVSATYDFLQSDACFFEEVVLVERLVAFFEFDSLSEAENWDSEFVFDVGEVVEINPKVSVVDEDCVEFAELLLNVFASYV